MRLDLAGTELTVDGVTNPVWWWLVSDSAEHVRRSRYPWDIPDLVRLVEGLAVSGKGGPVIAGVHRDIVSRTVVSERKLASAKRRSSRKPNNRHPTADPRTTLLEALREVVDAGHRDAYPDKSMTLTFGDMLSQIVSGSRDGSVSARTVAVSMVGRRGATLLDFLAKVREGLPR